MSSNITNGFQISRIKDSNKSINSGINKKIIRNINKGINKKIIRNMNVAEKIVPEKIVPETIVPDMIVPDMIVPDMIVPDMIVPDMIVPDYPMLQDDKIAFVTAIFGNYDTLNDVTNEYGNIDYICFTDTNLQSNKWKIIKDPLYHVSYLTGVDKNDKILDPITRNMMIAKFYKINHHKIDILQKYKYTIWIDGRGKINNIDFKKYIETIMKNKLFGVFKHSRFINFIDDALYCSNFMNDYSYLKKRYMDQNMIGQSLEYIEQLPHIDNNNYFELGFIIRNNVDNTTKYIMDIWWDHCVKCSYQDQISFSFINSKMNIPLIILGNNIYNNDLITILTHTHDNRMVVNKPLTYTTSDIVTSFDFWDTLFGRLCYHPHNIFEIIGERLGIKNFKELRVDAEIKQGSTYTLKDIYKTLYPSISNSTSHDIDTLCTYELMTEMNTVFPIDENYKKFNNNSIIVSDFYYSDRDIMKFLNISGIYIDADQVYISNNGKRTGHIWQNIKNKWNVSTHIGDNYQSDYVNSQNAGITSIHYNNGELNEFEKYVRDKGFPYVAYICRAVRLSCPYEKNTIEETFWNFYTNRQLPMLFSYMYAIKTMYPSQKKFSLMSRDMYLLFNLWKSVFPDDDISYLYISRRAMKNPSVQYINYVKDKCSDSVVIDLLGTGKSFNQFKKTYSINNKDYVIMYRRDGSNKTINRDVSAISLLNHFDRYIEKMNYSWHGSFTGFNNGHIECIPKEYNEELPNIYFRVVEKACRYSEKITDILSKYQYKMTINNIYDIKNFLMGSSDSTNYSENEKNILDMIQHSDTHDNIETVIQMNIPINYTVMLDEYIRKNFNIG